MFSTIHKTEEQLHLQNIARRNAESLKDILRNMALVEKKKLKESVKHFYTIENKTVSCFC